MADLGKMRADVLGGIQGARPTNDFPVPNRLVDYWILTISANAMYEKARRQRRDLLLDDWMLSEFKCQTAELDESECASNPCSCYDAKYKVSLPFTTMSIPGGGAFAGVFIESSMTPITLVSPKRIMYQKHVRFPASMTRPHGYVMGKTMYLFGGNRDFSKCKIVFHVAVSSYDYEGESCFTPVVVPLDADLEAVVIALAIQKGIFYVDGRRVDLASDYTFNPRMGAGRPAESYNPSQNDVN